MEHTNKNAIKILASEYSDYWKNAWHYDRQYNILCRMEKAVLPQTNVIKSLPSELKDILNCIMTYTSEGNSEQDAKCLQIIKLI